MPNGARVLESRRIIVFISVNYPTIFTALYSNKKVNIAAILFACIA